MDININQELTLLVKVKRLILGCGLLLFGSLTLQAQNPYKSLGVETEVLTLSKGKFVEFIPNDSLVQIGSVMFNTRTNSIVSFVVYDTTYSEATLEPEVSSRFLSPDPYAADYPNLSPYSYVANNPLLYTDPTGKYIVDSNGNRVEVTTTQDEDGNYINSYTFAEGTEQSVIDDFHANGGVILGAMAMTEEGRTQLGNLIDAEHSVGLTLSDEGSSSTGSRKGGFTNVKGKLGSDGTLKIEHAQITVYKGVLEEFQTENHSGDWALFQKMGMTGMIGAVGSHEAVHASDMTNIAQSAYNQVRGQNNDTERVPMLSTWRYTYQFLMNQRKKNK